MNPRVSDFLGFGVETSRA